MTHISNYTVFVSHNGVWYSQGYFATRKAAIERSHTLHLLGYMTKVAKHIA